MLLLAGNYLDKLTADVTVRTLLVTGAGDETFCAGASLKQLDSGDMNPELFTKLTDKLANCAIPTVCALNGNVYGGGAELALCCDYRIGISNSKLMVPAARIGLFYPLNGMQRYVERFGLDFAKRVLVCAEEIKATELLRLGFLHQVVDADKLEDAALSIVEQLKELAPLAVRSMKTTLQAISDGTLDRQKADLAAALCAESNDLKEGLAAKKQKRQPVFTGR